METIHKGVQEAKTLPVSRSPALCSSSLTHHVLFLFSKLEKKHARINSVGAEASQRATNDSVICYFASVQGSSPSSHLRDVLCLTALSKDAAWSSHSWETFRSFTFPFDTCTDPLEKWYSPPADVKTHFAPSCILPKSKWGLGRMPPAFFLLHNPFSNLWCFCCCCLHKAFQSHWNPLDFKAKHTNTWLCESTAMYTMKSRILL